MKKNSGQKSRATVPLREQFYKIFRRRYFYFFYILFAETLAGAKFSTESRESRLPCNEHTVESWLPDILGFINFV